MASRLGARVRAILPWVVAIGLLAYLLAPYARPARRAELALAFGRAPAWTALIAAGGALGAYIADTFATFCVLAWASVRLRFREVAVMRGVTYFLAIVNYSLGQAAMIYVLARHGVRALRASGVILFIIGVNVLVLLAIASVSVAAGAPAPRPLRVALYVMGAGLPIYLLLLLVRPGVLARRELFAPLFEMGVKRHLAAMLVRLPHVFVMMLAQWLVMRCFGVAAPALAAALYLPIVFAVAVLPISAQGLGTSQLLAIQFFGRYAPGDASEQQAAVLAYSLYLIAIWIPVQILIGALCIRTEFGRAMQKAPAPS